MVAVHPGMKDQTDSNIARDGASKKTQTKFPVKEGMKDQTDASKLRGLAPDSSFGAAPDASSPNPLDPSPKVKKFGPVATSWGMKGKHDPQLGSAVLSEASNLGR